MTELKPGRVRRWWRRWRSAVTGRWVSRDYASQHPDTTVAETVPARRKSVSRQDY